MMTGSELSLILILILLVQGLMVAAPWPAALLVGALAAERGRIHGLAAAGGVLLAVLGWAVLGRAGIAAPWLATPTARFWLGGLSALVLLGLAVAAARVALGRRQAGPGAASPALAALLTALLHASQPGVAVRWGSLPGRLADLDLGTLPGLALVAFLYAALALLLALPRPRAAYARHAPRVQGVLAALYLAAALIALLRLA